MAEIYTVCASGVATNSTVEMTVPSVYDIRNYFDGNGCNVREETMIATFTCTVPSDESFNIYYNYTIEYYTNGVSDGAPILQEAFVTMPANSTIITKQIFHYVRFTCPDETSVDEGIGEGEEVEG